MNATTKLFRRNRREAGAVPDPDWLRWLDHTADAGLSVRATSCTQLFERAAWGMFALLTDMAQVQGRQFLDLDVSAPDREALMVRWLSELNYLHASRGMVFCRFEVGDADETSLRARVGGEPIDPDRHLIRTEIKAVTFHELAVQRAGRTWMATVLFDL